MRLVCACTVPVQLLRYIHDHLRDILGNACVLKLDETRLPRYATRPCECDAA